MGKYVAFMISIVNKYIAFMTSAGIIIFLTVYTIYVGLSID
jgi:hypothetical protein